MRRKSSLLKRLKNMNGYSYLALKLGVTLMFSFYILAVVAYVLAPHVPDYFYAMSVHRGSVEAAPACLAVGVCAALLGDLMLGGKEDGDG